MKPSAPPPPRLFAVCAVLALGLLLALPGCGRRAASRPASSLAPKDRAVLDQYEQIRVALASDNLQAARLSATGLVKLLTPEDAKAPAPEMLAPATALTSALALDRARQTFKILSTKIIPLADGVEGFYVMTYPIASSGDWVQQNPKVDNPYMGKGMHDFGDLKK